MSLMGRQQTSSIGGLEDSKRPLAEDECDNKKASIKEDFHSHNKISN